MAMGYQERAFRSLGDERTNLHRCRVNVQRQPMPLGCCEKGHTGALSRSTLHTTRLRHARYSEPRGWGCSERTDMNEQHQRTTDTPLSVPVDVWQSRTHDGLTVRAVRQRAYGAVRTLFVLVSYPDRRPSLFELASVSSAARGAVAGSGDPALLRRMYPYREAMDERIRILRIYGLAVNYHRNCGITTLSYACKTCAGGPFVEHVSTKPSVLVRRA